MPVKRKPKLKFKRVTVTAPRGTIFDTSVPVGRRSGTKGKAKLLVPFEKKPKVPKPRKKRRK